MKASGFMSLLAIGANIAIVSAFVRQNCFHMPGAVRMDPIASPGTLSEHAHNIHGSNAFSMTADYDVLASGSCTTCQVKEDKSAYWAPALQFQYSNGTVESVWESDGMTVYYFNQRNLSSPITAFPSGFRMIAGNHARRNKQFSGPDPDKEQSLWDPKEVTQEFLAERALGFNCLHFPSKENPNPPPNEPTIKRHQMPSKAFIDENCTSGLRLEIVFPSCWDGKSFDSDNHRDHVRYPSLVQAGTCPPGFEVNLPVLLLESWYYTQNWKGRDGQYVLSTGDATGTGYHADFMMGWQNTGVLQKMLDTCDADGNIDQCPAVTEQSAIDIHAKITAGKCNFVIPDEVAKENCDGPRQGFCGDQSKHEHDNDNASPEHHSESSPAPAPMAMPSNGYIAAHPSKASSSMVKVVESSKSPAMSPAPAPEQPAVGAGGKVKSRPLTTIGGKVFAVEYEEVTVTKVHTVFIKRGIEEETKTLTATATAGPDIHNILAADHGHGGIVHWLGAL